MYWMKRKRSKFLVFLLILFIFCNYQFRIVDKLLYPYPHKQIIEKYASAYGVDPLLVTAVIREESHFIPYSSSHKGAIGLMQLMPETAKEISAWLGENYTNVDLKKPEDNIRFGTWYLASLTKQYSGNHILVLAAYNAGSGRLNKWLDSSSKDLNSYLIEDIPFKETREYVQKVLASYKTYSSLYAENK
ncbi:MAG: Soluble lytic murein transglycosylase [Candidatus Dichloromethanomonas elyunquensis]|nr:MAG: Soluble lytic murein transglycosylase [Candidatus Dichloromethanomonas elyunquensis]